MSFFQTPSNLLLPILVALLLLTVFASLAGVLWAGQRSRFPIATTYIDLGVKLIQRRAELLELEERKAELDRQITDRSFLSAEVSALQQRIDTLQTELANLDSARREIDEVRNQAAGIAAEYATESSKLDALREEAGQLAADGEKARRNITELEQLTRETQSAMERMVKERHDLEAQMPELRAERDQAWRAIEEGKQAQAGLAAVSLQISAVEATIDGLHKTKAAIEIELIALNSSRAEMHRLQERSAELTSNIQRDEARLAVLDGAIERSRKELGDLEIRVGGGTVVDDPIEQAKLIEDLQRKPACLATPATSRAITRDEDGALGDVMIYLKDQGLKYDPRTLKAFHTALKINDKAQMTVLAGVSGTGKSLLPRRYSEAMGIHFLQIAVEPRWDSPQDLLGFYNYIEKKYRATDLARLLVHMDPFDVSGLMSERNDELQSHMAIVLLDEMNLARVEYYFSEFLSRLEARPPFTLAKDPARRRDATIPMDIRGLKQSISLFPSHNVLFTGTMNDDESTQSLSDKVLDRANVLQFAAPKSFETSACEGKLSFADKAQPFEQWSKWVKAEDRLGGSDRSKADETIRELADIMQKCGRPFGHRLRDSILAYAVNYPRLGSGSVNIAEPLVDQIELRILPKLRGVQIEGAPFEELSALVRNNLGDALMATRIDELVDQQRNTSGMFVWRGLTR